MWLIVIGALVSLLVYFFERWWTNHHPTVTAEAKEAFLKEINRPIHFWMGPGRAEIAGRLFDKFAARYAAKPPTASDKPLSADDARALAEQYAKDLIIEGERMSTQKIEVTVSTNAYVLAQGVRDFVLDLKAQVDSGDQRLVLLMDVVRDSVNRLVPVIWTLSQLGMEKNENLRAFMEAFEQPLKDLAFAFMTPPAPGAPETPALTKSEEK